MTRAGEDGRRLAARDALGNLRLLVHVPGAQEARRLTPLLLDCRDNAAFSDFIEFFPEGDGLTAVFAHSPGGAEPARALSGAPNAMRAAALRSLFAQILSQSLPEAILREALRAGNLLVAPDGSVRFLYGLPREAETEDGAEPAGRLLSETAKRIVGDSPAPEAAAFADRLAFDAFTDYFAMYAAADAAASALEAFAPAPAAEKRPLEKAKAKAEAAAGRLRAGWLSMLAAAALIIGYVAVGALFYGSVIDPPGADNNIRFIGTVVVADGP